MPNSCLPSFWKTKKEFQQAEKAFQDPVEKLKADLEELGIRLLNGEDNTIKSFFYTTQLDLGASLSLVLKQLKDKGILEVCRSKVFANLNHIERVAHIFSLLEPYHEKGWLNKENVKNLYRMPILLPNINEVITILINKKIVTCLNIKAAFSYPRELKKAIEDREKAAAQPTAIHASSTVNAFPLRLR